MPKKSTKITTKKGKEWYTSLRGRPCTVTPQVIAKLEDAFKKWYTDEKACIIADVSLDSLKRYCAKNPDFRTWKEMIKKQPSITAQEVLVSKVNEWDLESAKWWLERKDKEEFDKNREEPKGNFFQNVQIQINYVDKPETLPTN